MKVLILGGDGFIGSHLRKTHLKRKDKVCIIDKETLRSDTNNDEYEFHQFDLVDNLKRLEKVIHKFNPDFVYNCVAVANPHFYVLHPIKTFDLDFTLNYDIDRILMKHKKPFMQFSTSEVYGKKWTEICKEDETDLIIGPTCKQRWIYATSKILLEQLLLSHHNNGEADCCIVRPQNFAGYDMDWIPDIQTNINNKWKPRLPACFLNNLFMNKPLNVVLPGTQKRCYTHIDDAIDGLLSIVDNWKKCKGQVLNVGNPYNEITIQNVANLVQSIWKDITGKEIENFVTVTGEKFYGKGYEDCERRLFDHSKIKQLTGWEPKHDIHKTFYDLIFDAIKHFQPDLLGKCSTPDSESVADMKEDLQ